MAQDSITKSFPDLVKRSERASGIEKTRHLKIISPAAGYSSDSPTVSVGRFEDDSPTMVIPNVSLVLGLV